LVIDLSQKEVQNYTSQMYSLFLMIISIVAGFLGSILGLGGGIIVVPALTLLFNVDIRYAVAASLISIIATSSGAAASFLRDHLTNIRVAVVLEIGTVTGAMTGFLISHSIKSSWLYILFGSFLLMSSILMFKNRKDPRADKDHPWSRNLGLAGSYKDENNKIISYSVANVPLGVISMYFAGVLSALLGIGSGIFKVLAMDGAMKLPLKVSSATSNFMIGVTAAASAGAYFLKGDIRPEIASPVAIGILIGAYFGPKVMTRMKTSQMRKLFVGVLVFVSFQMILKGIRG
jgi:uncharacterized membrane protein YfcA